VLVGERTAALVGGAFELGEPHTVEAKGKEGGVVARELRRMLAARRPRGGHGLATTFVGRARELEWLEQAVASTQQPRFVLVAGEPGLGKTTLIRELREQLASTTTFRIGRCLSYGRSVTYSPLADVLREELGLREEDSAAEALAGREILGLTIGLDVAGDLEPRAAVLALQDAWVRLISEIGARGPVVLVLEDLHWAAEPHEAFAWNRRRLALAGRFTDPDHLALVHWGAATAELLLGHMSEAEAHALRHEAIAARLTPHHAIHSLGNLVTLDEAAGRWDRLHERKERIERTVAANADTPCVYNPRSLLACAVACAALGLDDEASRLEAEEAALGFEGYALWLDALRARLALIRGDLERVDALLDGSERWRWPTWNYVNGVAARLDALLALGRAEEALDDAQAHAVPGTYLEPFALRVLGVAGNDPALVGQAQERFTAMRLDWYAAQTRELASGVVR